MNRMQISLNFDVLSAREREVMVLAAKGLANKVIARELKIAEGTIKLHLHRVYQKLGIKGRLALAARLGNLPAKPRDGRGATRPRVSANPIRYRINMTAIRASHQPRP